MPKPVSFDAEFVELYNLSPTDSVDISDLKLKDNLSLSSLIHVWGPRKLAPNGFAVILDRDYFEPGGSGQYNDILPAGIPVYKTSNASIGNGLGNSTDNLALLSADGKDTLSWLSWTLPTNFPSGYSIEKRNSAGPGSDHFPAKNWQQSNWLYGSPGNFNSVPGIPLTDLGLKLVGYKPENPWLGDSIFTELRICNPGLQHPNLVTLKVLELDDGGNPLSETESGISPPGPDDSLTITISVFPGSSTSSFLFKLITSGDENPVNDSVSVLVNLKSGIPGDVQLLSVLTDSDFIQTETEFKVIANLKSRDLISGNISIFGRIYYWDAGNWQFNSETVLQTFSPFTGEKQISIPVIPSQPGYYRIDLKLESAKDPNPQNDTLSFQFEVFWPVSDEALTLSELMPNPEGTDGLNEFVELFNPKANRTGDLSKIRLLISGKTDLLISGRKRFIQPGERILVHHPLYNTQTIKLYDGIEDTLNSVQAVSNLPLVMKNSSESVVLLSVSGDTLDKLIWLTDPGNGISLEKILPEVNNKSQNWGKSKEHHGTPGWQNSLLPSENKSQVFLRISELTGQQNKSVTLNMKVVNQGRKSIDSGNVSVYQILPGHAGQLLSMTPLGAGITLEFGDSLVTEFVSNLTIPGETRFFARFENPDLSAGSDTLSLQIPFEPGCLLINEFLPAGDKSAEFIEFFNPSPFPVYLDGWQIANSSSAGKVTLRGSDLVIQPGNYGVLFRDTTGVSSFLKSGKAWWIKTLPAMKDTGDVIKISAPGGILIDSLTYRFAWFSQPLTDFSVEKTEPEFPSAQKENWMKSWDQQGTPGKKNSRFPFQNNVAILNSEPVILRPGETKTVFFRIQNRGKNPIALPELSVWADTNQDLLPDAETPLTHFSGSDEQLDMGALAEISITASWAWTETGHLLVQLSLPEDENPDDDIQAVDVKSSVKREIVKISEILFDPRQDGNDGKPDHSEYVEIYNPGTEAVSIENWTIRDRPSETGNQNMVKINSKFSIQPSDFGVISADSGLFDQFSDLKGNPGVCILNVSSLNLNADGDAVILKDQWGSVVDSVFYSAKWQSKELATTKSIALERRNLNSNANDPLNWSSSVNPAGGTPGKSNSVKLPESGGSKSSVWVSPNPFSPDEDGRDDVCELHYRFSEPVSSASVTIYDRLGRKIKELKPWSLSGPEGVIFWDGKKEDGQIAPIGPYIFLTEFMNPAGGKIHEGKTVVILAKKM
ncbi:MAG: lamin tail domain-containing protein [Bacteroidetes bacterium]|nr:lamin tail domain-containing protein [Bacteroidota bacterium]